MGNQSFCVTQVDEMYTFWKSFVASATVTLSDGSSTVSASSEDVYGSLKSSSTAFSAARQREE